MYESMNDVPDIIKEYYEEGEELMLLPRPEPKSEKDVERMLSLGKPQVLVEKFAELAEENLHWKFYDDAVAYLEALEAVELASEEFVPEELEDGTFTEFVEPVIAEPVRDTRTALQLTQSSPSYTSYLKQNGADVGGYTISLNESNQNGIASVYTGLALAIDLGQDPFPVNLRMENGSKFTTVPFEDLESYKMFAMEFLALRQQFF